MSSRGPEGEQPISVELLKLIRENPWNVPTFSESSGWRDPVTDMVTERRERVDEAIEALADLASEEPGMRPRGSEFDF